MEGDMRTDGPENATEVAGQDERLVMCWRCGWCGAPTREDGQPLAMSEIGLTKNIEKNWANAELVHGKCCADVVFDQERYEYEMRTKELDT